MSTKQKEDTSIYFIRHGEVDNPRGIIYGRAIDVPLSEEGIIQIKNLVGNLKRHGVNPEVIYTSPHKRTIQSANELSKVFSHAKVIVCDELMETDEPMLADKTVKWLELGGDEYGVPGVERPESIVRRMMRIVEEIVHKYQGKMVFVVSSGDPIAFLIWRLIHHEGNLPSISELKKDSYLGKGEAWKIRLTPNLEVTGSKLIVCQ